MILTLETTTPICAIALRDGANTILEQTLNIPHAHSQALTLLISQALERSGVSKQQLTAVAVSAGPGSYTGLRIGASVAKGLCFALELPLLAVDTLQAMAAQVQHFSRWLAPDSLLMPMMDARRMEVYTALYAPDLRQLSAPKPLILTDENPFAEVADQPVLFFGDGAAKAVELMPPHFQHLPGILPNARSVAQLAQAAYAEQQFADLAYFEPTYLKGVHFQKPKPKLPTH